MRFSIEGFEHFKNMIHPSIVSLKRHYLKNKMYVFPTYHGCGNKNKDESNRQIDYKRGGHCLFPTFKKYGKKKTKKRIKKKLYYTRYMSNIDLNNFAKMKNNMWYDYNEKKYKQRAAWFYHKMDPYKFVFSNIKEKP